jgi:hypothetical protein
MLHLSFKKINIHALSTTQLTMKDLSPAYKKQENWIELRLLDAWRGPYCIVFKVLYLPNQVQVTDVTVSSIKKNDNFAICAELKQILETSQQGLWRLWRLILSYMSKWNGVGSKYVRADVVERRLQHATFSEIPVMTTFNSSSKSACQVTS